MTDNAVADFTAPEVSAMTGMEQLRLFGRPGGQPAIGKTLGFELVSFDEGLAVFEGDPDERTYNPLGGVHGGYAATLLDSACGIAVHSRMAAGQRYTTLELKISYLRGMTAATGRVRAEGRVVSMGRRVAFAEATLTDQQGRLMATATSTLLVMSA